MLCHKTILPTLTPSESFVKITGKTKELAEFVRHLNVDSSESKKRALLVLCSNNQALSTHTQIKAKMIYKFVDHMPSPYLDLCHLTYAASFAVDLRVKI